LVFMERKQRERISEVIRLCNEKIEAQRRHESLVGYGEDYDDGRVVGGAALARRVLELLKDIPW
jgi:hypothetical protein